MPDAPADIRYVAKNMRLDLRLIAEMIPHGAKLLDIGCGDGALIEHLAREKQADARGIEIDMAEVTKAVSSGLAVIHGDADHGRHEIFRIDRRHVAVADVFLDVLPDFLETGDHLGAVHAHAQRRRIALGCSRWPEKNALPSTVSAMRFWRRFRIFMKAGR